MFETSFGGRWIDGLKCWFIMSLAYIPWSILFFDISIYVYRNIPPESHLMLLLLKELKPKIIDAWYLIFQCLLQWETHVLSHRFSPWSATSPEKSTSLTEPPSNDRWRVRALEIRPAGRQWCCATSTCPSNLANLVELLYGKRAPQWPMRMGKIKIISRISRISRMSRMSRISRISRIGNDCQNLGTSLTI